MKAEPRSENITARVDKKTLEFFRKIAIKEQTSISRVVCLGLKKLMADYQPEEITREVN